MTDAFNTAAEKKDATRQILDAITATRRHLQLADAIDAKDWKKAGELVEAGASPLHRGHKTLEKLTREDSIEVHRLIAKLDLGGFYRQLPEAPFIMAAKTGNMLTIHDGLDRKVSADVMSRALAVALFNKQDAVADLLLQNLPQEKINDHGLFGLLVHRPAVYDAVVATRTERVDLPDYIGHFYNAAYIHDDAAMEKSLDLMIAHKDKLSLFMMMPGMDEFDGGGPYGDIAYVVTATGNQKVIDRFVKNFEGPLPGRVTRLHMALMVREAHPGMLQHVAETAGATKQEMLSVSFSLNEDATSLAAARYYVEHWPEVTKEKPAHIIRVLARNAPDEFVTLMEKGEIALPKEARDLTMVLASAIAAKTRAAEDWILAHGDITPEVIRHLQENHEYAVQKRAADLGGTMRFEKDVLFWGAVEKGDKEVLAAFPRDPLISTDTTWRVGNALKEVVAKGDIALFTDIVDHADWKEDSKKQLLRAVLKSKDALEVLEARKLLPDTLKDVSMVDIAEGGGAETLKWFESHGREVDEKLTREGLGWAIHRNAVGMVEYLLAKSPDLEKDVRPVLAAIDNSANFETLAVVEKWRTRGEIKPAPGLAAEIAAARDLFAGDDSVAVRAAYADGFASVMKKAAADAAFNPDILAATKDKFGNTLLEILGAHGKLGEILEPAGLWRNRDARAFIESNTPALYHAQVDYSPLKAALDLLHLQEASRSNRFKLK